MTVDTCKIPLNEDSSGVILVENTRVTLDSLVHAFREGSSAEEIAERYPAVSLSSVYAAITFYLQNRLEIDTYLQRRRNDAERLREKIDTCPETAEFRSRLLARKSDYGQS